MEITVLKETLTTTTHKRVQGKANYADLSDRLQFAEQLLEKAKSDSREKNCRIKTLETHLDKARNKISHHMRQLDHRKEESYSVTEKLKTACEWCHDPSR